MILWCKSIITKGHCFWHMSINPEKWTLSWFYQNRGRTEVPHINEKNLEKGNLEEPHMNRKKYEWEKPKLEGNLYLQLYCVLTQNTAPSELFAQLLLCLRTAHLISSPLLLLRGGFPSTPVSLTLHLRKKKQKTMNPEEKHAPVFGDKWTPKTLNSNCNVNERFGKFNRCTQTLWYLDWPLKVP